MKARQRIVWLRRDGRAELVRRLVETSLLLVNDAEIRVRLRIAGVDLERALKCVLRLCEILLVKQQDSVIVPGVGAAGVQLDGRFEILLGPGGIACPPV